MTTNHTTPSIPLIRDMLAEAQAASNLVKGSDEYAVFTARARGVLAALAFTSAERGVFTPVVCAYFAVAADEPHRLPKLIDSLYGNRMDDVIRALLDYQRPARRAF